MTIPQFTTPFAKHVVEGDTITVDHGDYVIRARIYRDNDAGKPDQNNDGFWPSKDPSAAGYVLSENYDSEMAKAKKVMAAWKRGDWFYCGVCVAVYKGDDCLSGFYNAALWGVECNYPDSDNSYLLEVANELVSDALSYARIAA